MKPTYFLAGMFTLAVVLVDLVVVIRFATAETAVPAHFWGLAFGQLALLSYWCGLGTGPWFIRLVAVITATALISIPIGLVTAGGWSTWFAVMSVFCLTTAVPTVALRRWGIRLTVDTRVGTRVSERRTLAWSQYSFGGMLSLVSIIGIVMGLSRHITFPWPHTTALAGYGICLTVVALTAFWAVVSRGPTGTRLITLAALCIVAGIAMSRTEHVHNLWYFTVAAFAEAIFICLGITVLQVAGWPHVRSPGVRCRHTPVRGPRS